MSTEIQTIQYKLHPSKLLEGKERSLVAQVITKETYNTEAIARRMADEGCPHKAGIIQSVLNEFGLMVTKLTSEGRRINLNGIMQIYPVIKGTFKPGEEGLNPAFNFLSIGACGMQKIKASVVNATTIRLNKTGLPVLVDAWDAITNTKNILGSGHLTSIYGANFTLDETQSDEGVWFISQESVETKVSIIGCMTDEAFFNCPTLATGDYTLVIRTRSGAGASAPLREATLAVKVIGSEG